MTQAGPSSYHRSPNDQQVQGFSANFIDFNQPISATSSFAPDSQINQSFVQQTSSTFDPASLIFALSSRLPTVETGSVDDETSPNANFLLPFQDAVVSGSSGHSLIKNGGAKDEKKTVKVTWWRPHGQTAIAPGESDLRRIGGASRRPTLPQVGSVSR